MKKSVFSKQKEEIENNLTTTSWMGFTPGLVGIVGYSLFLEKDSWKFLFLSILLASASYIIGFFLGFLFGIPKRNSEKETAYNLSTNLVDISDWLTKIIIGLGLIEIRGIGAYLMSIGEYVQKQTNGENSIKVFVICCVSYFFIFGVYYGYNYMRLYLSGQFKVADDNLLKLNEKAEVLDELVSEPTIEINSSMKKNLEEYELLLKNTKEVDEYSFDDWFYKGMAEYGKKDYNKAIDYFGKALEKDKDGNNAPKAHLYIGLAFERLNVFEKGIEKYNYIISNFPNYNFIYGVHSNRAILYHKLENYNKALEDFDKAISLNPNYENAYWGKANTLRKLRRYDEALIAIEKSIEKKGDNDVTWAIKGSILINLDRLDEALNALSTAIRINSKNESAWYNKACIYSLKNEKENMLVHLVKAIELKEEYKGLAMADEDFRNYWNDDAFKKLIEM
ncbi:MAG: hypothetical protein K0S32_2050 [Bacteroidetes bacterium]|jgi:tetratricopeptide (TPR) repeat protein|nr:hypothetical protein [Bacteroidota bacterium]